MLEKHLLFEFLHESALDVEEEISFTASELFLIVLVRSLQDFRETLAFKHLLTLNFVIFLCLRKYAISENFLAVNHIG